MKRTVIEFAEKRLIECEKDEGNYYDMQYWAAYLDGARAQKAEDDNESNDKL